MNIVWLSANRFGYELLKEVLKLDNVEISTIITLSPGSKTLMYDGVSCEKWKELGIRVIEVDRINEESSLMRELSPDLVIMCGWRQVLDKNILYIPKQGFVGFHPTLLPIGRGPAPIINTLLKGFRESGVSMFYVSGGLDDGDIIGQEGFSISETDHAAEVYEKVIVAGKKLIRLLLPKLIDGSAARIPQDNKKATFFTKPSGNRIDIEKDTVEEIYGKIKALSKPYKGAYIEKEGRKLILWRAELEK